MPAAAGNHPGHQPGTTQARHLTGQGQLPCAHKGPNFVSVTIAARPPQPRHIPPGNPDRSFDGAGMAADPARAGQHDHDQAGAKQSGQREQHTQCSPSRGRTASPVRSDPSTAITRKQTAASGHRQHAPHTKKRPERSIDAPGEAGNLIGSPIQNERLFVSRVPPVFFAARGAAFGGLWLHREAWPQGFLAAEDGRRPAAPPGRSSLLRCGRSTRTCGFTDLTGSDRGMPRPAPGTAGWGQISPGRQGQALGCWLRS